ncbi:MAG: hypothetical protein ACTSXJ_10330 [Candidatus Baldrarchaeia archaeon]
MGLVEEFVKNYTKSCTAETTYTVTLKWDKIDDAYRRILSKGKVISKMPMLTRVVYEGVEITLFRTGKMVIKKLGDRDIREFLENLLSDSG